MLKPFSLRVPGVPSLVHCDQRDDCSSDVAFANFRPMILGNRESSTFFRSATILNSPTGRSSYVAQCATENGIAALFDLSGKIENYDDLRVFSCNPGKNGDSLFYHKVFADCLRRFIERPLIPVLFCCEAGKYRTGFVSILLEGLSGTDADNIEQDFMQSYTNNNGVAQYTEAYKKLRHLAYEPIIEQLQLHCGGTNFSICARNYFSMIGLTNREIDRLAWLLRV